jgi:ribosomal protein S1
MRYYKDAGVPVGEIITPGASVVESARQAEIAKVTESQEFKEGDVIEAKVTKISGNKVSYEILGVIKLTEKEPKKAALLQEGQTVKVKIAALKEDGSIKSIKCVD